LNDSRKRLWAAAVAAVGLALAPTASLGAVRSTTEWRQNPIRGTVPAELVSYMRAHMIADEDGPAFANITHDHDLSVSVRPAGEICRVDALTFDFRFVITLPVAVDEGRMAPATRRIWREFAAYTKWHEGRHREIFLDCAARFAAVAERMVGRDGCPALERRVKKSIANAFDACMSVQRAFDHREAPRVAALALFRSAAAKKEKNHPGGQ
jgi:predicted secreted Zn-dependent protease